MKQDKKNSRQKNKNCGWGLSLAFVVAFLITGCIESPLLQHLDATPAAEASVPDAMATATPTPTPVAHADQEPNQRPSTQPCTFFLESEKLCVSMAWVKQPKGEEKGEILLGFWRRGEGDAVSGPFVDPVLPVAVKLWMPSMGHGSAPVMVAPYLDANQHLVPGVLRVTEVYFVMPGQWQILVQLKKDKKVIDQTAIDVEI